MATIYEHNFGFWEIDGQVEQAFFEHVQRQSVQTTCERCERRVRLMPPKTLCASCVTALEFGAPTTMSRISSRRPKNRPGPMNEICVSRRACPIHRAAIRRLRYPPRLCDPAAPTAAAMPSAALAPLRGPLGDLGDRCPAAAGRRLYGRPRHAGAKHTGDAGVTVGILRPAAVSASRLGLDDCLALGGDGGPRSPCGRPRRACPASWR